MRLNNGRLAAGGHRAAQRYGGKTQGQAGPGPPAHTLGDGQLAAPYQDAGKLDEAEYLLLELLQNGRKNDGPKSAATASVLASLGLNPLQHEKYVQAEPIIRECLVIREQQMPDD